MGIEKFIKSVCVQDAVYWSAPTPDGYGGYTFASPTAIKCRWDEKIELFTDAQGKEVTSKAIVLVTQDMQAEGYLYLGSLSELSPDQKTNPKLINGAYIIRRFDKTPMIKSTTEFVRTVYL